MQSDMTCLFDTNGTATEFVGTWGHYRAKKQAQEAMIQLINGWS